MKECPKCKLCLDDEQNTCPHDNQMLFVSNNCGTTLDNRYILERRLGKGGMGAVYKGKHVHLKSTHAIKIISPEVVKSDPTLKVRFTQEAVLAASIHHPNVVNVTDFGVENTSTLFLVMEFIDGISLDDFLRKEKRLSPLHAFELLKPIALGVGAAHHKGITHRDIKPLNVMLRAGLPPAQAVKVLDFGLAKIKSSESFSSLVMAKTTSLLGSPHYMPPEQWDNENVDTRSDIYSLGIILFQMITGEVPFKGSSIPNIMYQHLQSDVPTFESLGGQPSPRIESVIRKALAKEQDDRFATVEEFLFAYESALFNTNEQIGRITNEKTVSFSNERFPSNEFEAARKTAVVTAGDSDKTYNLPYLDSAQNQTLTNFFNNSKTFDNRTNVQLEQEFLHAQNRVEEARTKVNEAEKLASEFNEAQKAAEEARQKLLQAQKQIEEEVRRQMQAEMDSKLAVEKEARRKAEEEAQRLLQEANARKEAEERANALAKTALEARQRAEEQQKKAEREMQQRRLEEGTRRKAEEAALKLAAEAAEAKRKYEEAKREAEKEAYFRMEAEIKRKKVEEEIHRIAQYEAEKRRIAEAQAAQQIKEQASRLEKQALEAEAKANEARRLAQSEAEKREQAEAARIKAEEEARRLAEEIIEAQKRLEEAEQFAQSESRKREQEEEARKKAEESARSLAEKAKLEKEQFEARISAGEISADSANQQPTLLFGANSFADLKTPTKEKIPVDTASSGSLDTGEFSGRNIYKLAAIAIGILIFVTASFSGGYMIYKAYSETPGDRIAENESNVNRDTALITNKETSTNSAALPARVCQKMVLIKGGEFMMGRNDANPNDERIYGSQYPAHTVSVEDFYLDRTEVTNEEYAEFVRAESYKPPAGWQKGKPPAGQEKLPVTNVSYFDARNFADWISARDNVPCRLPTEEEWEYAARSGSRQNIFPWGNEWIAERANFATGTLKEAGSTDDETAVGNVKDMLGNVLEWTSSTMHYYPNFPENLKENVSDKISVRGVSYTKKFNAEKTLQKTELLLTLRQGVSPDRKFDFLGFRLMCNAK
jgi:serine/threonine-protein kinase